MAAAPLACVFMAARLAFFKVVEQIHFWGMTRCGCCEDCGCSHTRLIPSKRSKAGRREKSYLEFQDLQTLSCLMGTSSRRRRPADLIRSVWSVITRGRIFWEVCKKDHFVRRLVLCVCVFWNVGHLSLISCMQETKAWLRLAEPAGWWGLFWIYNHKLEDKRAIKFVFPMRGETSCGAGCVYTPLMMLVMRPTRRCWRTKWGRWPTGTPCTTTSMSSKTRLCWTWGAGRGSCPCSLPKREQGMCTGWVSSPANYPNYPSAFNLFTLQTLIIFPGRRRLSLSGSL